MKENIEQMRKRHKKEILDLQESCLHEHQQVHVYKEGLMAHGGDWEDYCEDCGKIIAYYMQLYKKVKKGNYSISVPIGEQIRVETVKLSAWYKEHPNAWDS